MKPPTGLVIEMSEQDVQNNLVGIIESMEKIRQESIANLGANDEQKMDYLRLSGELASCLKTFIEGNHLEEHVKAIKHLMDEDLLLRKYEPLQPDFWDEREPRLKAVINDVSAVLLRDDFVSEPQQYHIFQALKYLTISNDAEKEDVYETILPVNSSLHESSLSSPEVSSYLMGKLLEDVVSDGVGVKVNIDMKSFVKNLGQTGALYVDVPPEIYKDMKKSFPKTILIEESGQKHTRVIFGNREAKAGINVFRQLQEFAQLDLGEKAEESLVRKMSNFYGFGKEFLRNMRERIGVQEDKQKTRSNNLESKTIGLENYVIEIDAEPYKDNYGNPLSQTQDNHIQLSNSLGKVMLDAAFVYMMLEMNNKSLLGSIRKDAKESVVRITPRFIYERDSLNAQIIHFFGSQFIPPVPYNILVPDYSKVPTLDNVLGTEEGYKYMQAYWMTKDSPEEIKNKIETISKKKANKIKIWTPDQASRASNLQRAAGLIYCGGEFHVLGYLYNSGRSRGVFVNPR
ncbi:hypothetical protein HZB88_03520 [archaeon]|nr:hypothetical protein [archaeon]